MDPNYGIPWASGLGSGYGPASQGDNGSNGYNILQHLGLMGGIGGIGAGLMGLFDQGQNPANAAMPYLNQIGSANQYTQPYNQIGQNAASALGNILPGLISNPGAFTNAIGANFHASPGFNFAMNNAMQQGNRAMGAGGLAGSPANSIQNQQTATGLANQNYYNYLQNAEGMFGQGMQGLQGLAGLGLGAGMNESNNIAQMLAEQAGLAYQGQANQNQNQNSAWGNLFGGLGDLAAL